MTHLNPHIIWQHTLANGFDIRPFLASGDPHRTLFETEEGRQHYAFKSAIAYLIQPGRILEIGTRGGYTAAAFLWGAERAEYVGVDRDPETVDKTRDWDAGLFPFAQSMLRACFTKAKLKFINADTQKSTAWLPPLLEEGGFDLIHVDGDHSYQGCCKDLATAYCAVNSGGFLLIDDFDHRVSVRRAVTDFLFANLQPHLYCCTWRGDMLINVHKK